MSSVARGKKWKFRHFVVWIRTFKTGTYSDRAVHVEKHDSVKRIVRMHQCSAAECEANWKRRSVGLQSVKALTKAPPSFTFWPLFFHFFEDKKKVESEWPIHLDVNSPKVKSQRVKAKAPPSFTLWPLFFHFSEEDKKKVKSQWPISNLNDNSPKVKS